MTNNKINTSTGGNTHHDVLFKCSSLIALKRQDRILVTTLGNTMRCHHPFLGENKTDCVWRNHIAKFTLHYQNQ